MKPKGEVRLLTTDQKHNPYRKTRVAFESVVDVIDGDAEKGNDE